jgi:hypothetical protein
METETRTGEGSANYATPCSLHAISSVSVWDVIVVTLTCAVTILCRRDRDRDKDRERDRERDRDRDGERDR